MEKASTPRNRYTRSAAKQVKTPSKLAQEESLEQNSPEDVKINVRKSRRKVENKPKTNGDTLADVDPNQLRNNKDVNDSANALNDCESEGSNLSDKQRNSPISSNHKTSSPTISRKSLRTRRSVTPGPELESSAHKKLKRSASEGKLESLGTPNKRKDRARSESKDFVFTPSKMNCNDKEKNNVLPESNSKFLHRNSSLRVIDKIVETIEEESSQDENELPKDTLEITKEENCTGKNSNEIQETCFQSEKKFENSSYLPLFDKGELEVVNNTDTNNKTDIENKVKEIDDKKEELCQTLSTGHPIVQEISEELSQETSNRPSFSKSKEDNIHVSYDNHKDLTDEDLKEPCKGVDDIPVSYDNYKNLNDEDKKEPCEGVDIPLSYDNYKDLTEEDKKEPCNGVDGIPVSYDSYKDLTDEDKKASCLGAIKTTSKSKNIEFNQPSTSVNEQLVQETNKESNTGIFKETNTHETKIINNDVNMMSVANDSEFQDISLKLSMSENNREPDVPPNNKTNLEFSETPLSVIQSENNSVTDNNKVRSLQEQVGNEKSTIEMDIVETKELSNALEPKTEHHKLDIENQESTTPLSPNDVEGKKFGFEYVFIRESKNVEPSDDVELVRERENIDGVKMSSDETLNVILEESEESNFYEKIDKSDQNKEDNATEINSERCGMNVEVVIEDSDHSVINNDMDENQTYFVQNSEESESFNIQVVDPHTVVMAEDSVVQFSSEAITQDPLEEDQSVNNEIIQETSRLEEVLDENDVDEIGENPIGENKKDNVIIKLSEQDKMAAKSSLKLDKNSELDQLDDNFDQDNYDGTSNKSEQDPASDSDIYKDLSDIGTDGEEKKNEGQFDDSVSSEIRSGESEEYVSSNDVGEEEEEGEEIVGQKNVSSADPKVTINVQKNNQTSNTKTGDKLLDISTPITYDKALAFLNKDREKKIDDEEFFDMFTQELNRVSDESDSDSDIAIVDEYIMEPEEIVKKPNKKPPNLQPNPKLFQKLTAPQQNQSISSAVHFAGAYNQHLPTQHNQSVVPRMNFSQGGMYHQYNQGIPHGNQMRSSVMYNQFGPSTNMADPRIFNQHVPPDANFTASGMFSDSVPVSDTQSHYKVSPALKLISVRSLSEMTNTQSSNVKITPYANSEHAASTVGLQINTPRDTHENQDNSNKNVEINTSTLMEKDDAVEQVTSHSSAVKDTDKGSTPILDLLGLDKVKLKLLKQVLGIDEKSKMLKIKKDLDEQHKKTHNRWHTKTSSGKTKQKMSHKERKRHRVIKKEKDAKKALIKRILENDSEPIHSRFTNYSTEHSSDKTATSSDNDFPTTSKTEHFNDSSDELTAKSEIREVNLEDGSVCITFNTRPKDIIKPRHRDLKHSKRAYNSSNYTSPEILKRIKKRKRAQNKSNKSSSSEDLDTLINSYRKMTKGEKQIKKRPTLVKSQCGTFVVDPLTATSQSSESDDQLLPEKSNYKSLTELKKSVKRDFASGKNKLSNLFSQHSSQPEKKASKRKVNEAFGGSEKHLSKKKKAKTLKKLPTEILEKLAEGRKSSRHQLTDSNSEETIEERPRKIRKRSLKVKVKSALAEEGYIPCLTSGATQFALSRLDKDGTLAEAEKAAKFRSGHLYGANVKRITNKELMSIKKKQQWNKRASFKKTAFDSK